MIWTAFIIGLMGSLHCVGMCGPIALSLPHANHNPWAILQNVLLYNVGRILTYSLLGAVIGLVSQGLFIAQLQKVLSIGLGVLLLVVVFFSVNVEHHLLKNSWISRFYFFIKMQFGRYLGASSSHVHFKVGVLNGFLPCGMVYLAIAGALMIDGYVESISYMILFGLGTLPLMTTVALLGTTSTLPIRRLLKKAYPFLLTSFAILLIWRGASIDVPLDLEIMTFLKNQTWCH